MKLTELLYLIDSKYTYSSVLDNIHNYPHLVNTALIKKNNIKIPNHLKGRVLLISNYLERVLDEN